MNEAAEPGPEVDTRIAVAGLGYVGLPLAVALVESGATAVGIDASPGRVADVNAGRSPIEDVSGERLGVALAAGFRAAGPEPAEIEAADVVVVCVPIPVTATRDPDLGPVLAAAHGVIDRDAVLSRSALVLDTVNASWCRTLRPRQVLRPGAGWNA